MIRTNEGLKRGRPSVASVVWRIVCLVVFLVAAYSGLVAGSVTKRTQMVHYTVGTGDTVWSISVRIAKEANVNPEAVEDDIVQANGLQDAQVWPGMDLLVPADKR